MYFKDVELAEKLVEKWCKEMNYTKEYEIRALPKNTKINVYVQAMDDKKISHRVMVEVWPDGAYTLHDDVEMDYEEIKDFMEQIENGK